MSAVWWTLTLLAALPMAVWYLANLLSLLDQRPVSGALIRLLIATLVVPGFLLVTDRALWTALATAFSVVLVLHAVSGAILRGPAMGVPHYGKVRRPSERDAGDERKEREEPR